MVDPQDRLRVPEKAPNSMLLQKVIRSPLQEALKFLSAHDLIHFYGASRYCQFVAKDDFLWRYLAEQTTFFHRHEFETWKASYLRCARIELNQDVDRTQRRFNYETCTIRHFRQSIVKLLDSYSNYVCAVDANGNLAVFWVDENDQENDEDTLQIQQHALNEEPIAMYLYPAERVKNARQQQAANELVIVTTRHIFHFQFTRQDQQLQLQLARALELPSQNSSNVYSCEVADKRIYVSNLPQSFADLSAEPLIHIYNANARTDAQATQEEIQAACLETHIFELEPDETDATHVSEWADAPADPATQRKKSKRQGLNLATMNPENGLLYVLLFNNKLLEINPKPSAAFLLRHFGRKSRVLKLQPALGKPIALEFHKGHLLLATDQSLIGWNVHKELNPEFIQNDVMLSGCDFRIDHNQNFDHNYVRVIKQPGKVCLIGNTVPPNMYWRDPQRQQPQKLVWISDGSQGNANAGGAWAMQSVETAFTPDPNKQITSVSQLAVSTTKKLLGNAAGACVQIWNFNRVAQGPHYLTVGSRSVKTNIPDPDYPEGVSRLVITPAKVVVALGNVIRVYSFDLKA